MTSAATKEGAPQQTVGLKDAWPLFLGLAVLALPTVMTLADQTWSRESGAHGPIILAAGGWLLWRLMPEFRRDAKPGSLVLIDETRRKVVNTGWSTEFERPIYFLEHRNGFACGWCTLNGAQLIVQPHGASACSPEVYAYPAEVDIIGQVTGVAMRLDLGKRRRARQ